jgi:hypothetical protein
MVAKISDQHELEWAAMGEVAWPSDWPDYLSGRKTAPRWSPPRGKPIPEFETWWPTWCPRSFDCMFGCAYDGLPAVPSPTLRLICANVSVRAEVHAAHGCASTQGERRWRCSARHAVASADTAGGRPAACRAAW